MSDARDADAVRQHYARRSAALADRYHPLRPEVMQLLHERQRAMRELFARAGWDDLSDKRIVEVGCGAGGNLVELLRLGAAPQHLAGIELLPERHAAARARLPAATEVRLGDARDAPVAAGSVDLVLLATVLSSLVDPAGQASLASAVWRWVKPGGAVLVYDFVVDNPRNPDVRGVPLARLRELFPGAALRSRRVTLAPPLARAAARVHPALVGPLAALPWLRTHQLTWVGKPRLA